MILHKNVSDDGYVFQETKLSIYSNRGNHWGKNDIFNAKQLIFEEISGTICCFTLLISQSRKNFLQDQIVSGNYLVTHKKVHLLRCKYLEHLILLKKCPIFKRNIFISVFISTESQICRLHIA